MSLKQEEIGGIPVPEQLGYTEVDLENTLLVGHMGFGEKNLSQESLGQGLVIVGNTLEALDLAIKAGANAVEIDITKSNSGEFVLGHPSLIQTIKQKMLGSAEVKGSEKKQTTLKEVVEWLSKQDKRVKLYVEMKSVIKLDSILASVDAIKDISDEKRDALLEQIIIYGSGTNILDLLKEKQQRGIQTDKVKLVTLTDGMITKEYIDQMASQGSEESRLYGVEQGAFWWMLPVAGDALRKVKHFFDNLPDTVDYAHSQGLKFIMGTADKPKVIRWLLRDAKVDGIVPNNPVDFENAGIHPKTGQEKIKPAQ